MAIAVEEITIQPEYDAAEFAKALKGRTTGTFVWQGQSQRIESPSVAPAFRDTSYTLDEAMEMRDFIQNSTSRPTRAPRPVEVDDDPTMY